MTAANEAAHKARADDSWTGGCACGRVRYRCAGPPVWQSYCHCSDCRRATGAPVSVFAGWKVEAVSFASAPVERRGGGEAVRGFCPDCGTPVFYRDGRLPAEIYLLAGTLDAPERIRPTCHAFTAEALPWLEIADDLPRHPRFSVARDQ